MWIGNFSVIMRNNIPPAPKKVVTYKADYDPGTRGPINAQLKAVHT